MANYYIDYENVHNEGLKGLSKLVEGDHLNLFYSNKADTLKIDVVRKLMKCPAEIDFVKILNGVENALDFQLITALMCNYAPEEKYYIISRDKGYDAAIEMANQQERNTIYRCKDIDGALKHQNNLGIDESDQEVIVDLELDESEPELLYPAEVDVPEDNQLADKPSQEQIGAAEQPLEEDLSQLQPEIEDVKEAAPVTAEEALEPAQKPEAEVKQTQVVQEDSEPAKAEEMARVAEDEKARRAYQSVCTKILNNLKNNHKIAVYYRQAGAIYEALAESDNKMQFYHRLIQTLGRKKGGELYQRVKTAYKSLVAIYKASVAVEESEAAEAEPAAIEAALAAQEKSITEQVMEALVDDMLESDNPEAEAAAVAAAVSAEIVKHQGDTEVQAKAEENQEAEAKAPAKKRSYKRNPRSNSRGTNRRGRKPKAPETAAPAASAE